MNRRQLFLSTAKAALLSAFGGAWLSGAAKAQTSVAAPTAASEGVIQGTLGDPSATLSIDGRVLPPAPPKFGGVIKESATGSKPWWPPRIVPPKGAPNVLLIMTDDQGYGVSSTFGGRHPDAGAGPDRQGGAALHPIPLDRALLAHARGADHRPQPSLGGLRRDHGVIDGFPGLRFDHRSRRTPLSARSSRSNGYATSWFGKNHNTPGFQYSLAGPFDQWPSGMGFEYFYGFMGGETDQWPPYLFRDHTQIFPWIGKPGYNLTTDMADEAIKLHEAAQRCRAREAVLPLLRARRKPLAAPADRRSGSTSSRASSTWAGMPCASRSSPTRNGSA